jgi:hypothetical protein
MDLSKLPKLSQTPPPPDNAAGPDPSMSPADAPALPVQQKVELYCRCGAPITPGTNFCSHCGANYYEAVGGGGAARSARDTAQGAGSGMWIEAFFSIAVGLFLIMMAPTGIKYLSATITGRPFTPYLHPSEPNVYVDFVRFQDTTTGVTTDYKYRDLFNEYWSDMAITAFALALILEGIVLAVVRKRWAVLITALIIVGATVFNLWYVAASFTRVSPITRQPYGFPPLSALAVIFGVVMAGYQLVIFKEMGQSQRRR